MQHLGQRDGSYKMGSTSEATNPLPAANSRRSFCFRRLGETCRSMALSELGSPAAVAEGDRSTPYAR